MSACWYRQVATLPAVAACRELGSEPQCLLAAAAGLESKDLKLESVSASGKASRSGEVSALGLVYGTRLVSSSLACWSLTVLPGTRYKWVYGSLLR